MKLYDYFRSSAAYRVRIALNLKGLEYQHIPVNLLNAEDQSEDYLAINPQGLVPALEDSGELLTQSLAICEYLEECHPEPSILPGSSLQKAQIRAIAQSIACDIHPVNNLRILSYLVHQLGVQESEKLAWYRHWIEVGFTALETTLAQHQGQGSFCIGEQPTLADICLVPQVFNAKRFEVDMTSFPLITEIEQHCQSLDAFQKAHPSNQPDAQS